MRRRGSTAKGKQQAAMSFPPAPEQTPQHGISIDFGVATPWTSGPTRQYSFDGTADSPYAPSAQAAYDEGSVSSSTVYTGASGGMSNAGVGSSPGPLSFSQRLDGGKRKRDN